MTSQGQPENEDQRLLSDAALTTFRLNGQLLGVAERLARPAGLTAAWWQVLGAALGEPQTVSGIARAMGLTRQAVQRIADLLVERGLAEYRENPAHRRAKLFAPSEAGRAAVADIHPAHLAASRALTAQMGADRLAEVLVGMHELSAALDRIEASAD
ncbi:putative MarR family transcriptional regulator [Gordonia araii NBRC 100433]|uniref:Putative MarR family transcriptional regulator n=1 Tax=Gordonia araii NBRC 100433 TaxID=1073574 RepID=G7H4Q7_9ACTN|nr:helix-turn-helix domain-containing protein [Gordonia araii]NNG98027.1 MarR family transcriptional regulator [Gordonia araii NBRC 100433]GAB10832.1 putative MarR family transcriptional regulator [Gordonia araii NBRC 100433]